MNKINYISAFIGLSSGLAGAASIGVNFSENSTNQGWLAESSPIGPVGIPSVNFNSNNDPNVNGPTNLVTGTLAAGTLGNLVDSLGEAVGMAVSWSSANPYYNGSGSDTNQAKLAVGYL